MSNPYIHLGLAQFIQGSPGLARFLNSEIKEEDEAKDKKQEDNEGADK